MTDPAAQGARAAAQRLTPDFHPGLVADVEAALQAQGNTPPDRYLDPVSIGALIVNIASLAWTIHTDLKKETPTPQPDAITRKVRIRLRDGNTPATALGPAERDRIIEITAEETLRAIDREPGGSD